MVGEVEEVEMEEWRVPAETPVQYHTVMQVFVCAREGKSSPNGPGVITNW